MATDKDTKRKKIQKRRERRRRRRLKSSVKIFLACFVLVVLVGGYKGALIYKQLHAPDNTGNIEVAVPSEVDVFDRTEEVGTPAQYWVLDVGKGESIFVKSGDKEVLIDTGGQKAGKLVVDEIRNYIDGDLDYLIITSPDKGRIGGIKDIFKSFNVSETIIGELGNQKSKVRQQISASKKIVDAKDMTLDLGEGIELTIFRPNVSSNDIKDQSLMTYFHYGQTGFLAESDAGTEEEARVLPSIGDCSAVVLSRYGSDQASKGLDSNLIASVLITSNKKQSGFPSEKMVNALNANFYATWRSGTLKFTSTGDTYTTNFMEQENALIYYR